MEILKQCIRKTEKQNFFNVKLIWHPTRDENIDGKSPEIHQESKPASQGIPGHGVVYIHLLLHIPETNNALEHN